MSEDLITAEPVSSSEEQSSELSNTQTDGDGTKLKWTIRPMRHADIAKCLIIWSQVDLTEAHKMVASVLSTDPEGFYVAELDDTHDVIGMCSACLVRADTAFVGFYAVLPEYQGLGIGRNLWSKTMSRFMATNNSINIGLYGVPEMSEKYKKSGFKIEDPITMSVFESPQGQSKDQLHLRSLKGIEELPGCRILHCGANNETLIKKIIDYDHLVQRFAREKLIRLFLTGEDAPLTLVVVRDHQQGNRKSSCCVKPSQESIMEEEALSTSIESSLSLSGGGIGELQPRPLSPIDIPQTASDFSSLNSGYDIVGYGCIRSDNNLGGMIGPIYADSGDVCEVILSNLISRFELKPGHILSVMSLSSNQQANRILTKAGLNEMALCSRLWTKYIPSASFSKIFYVHSPNFTLF